MLVTIVSNWVLILFLLWFSTMIEVAVIAYLLFGIKRVVDAIFVGLDLDLESPDDRP